MPTQSQTSLLRRLPPVDRLLSTDTVREWLQTFPRALVLDALRDAIASARETILAASTDQQLAAAERAVRDLLPAARARLAGASRPSLRPVINATGIIVHTNLGRSRLPTQAVEAMAAAAGYCNLETDLATGERGSRHAHLERLLCRLTGADAGIAVNNNAAAVLLALNTLADGREVIVSRGQLVEIGGSFRMPDVMAKSGCRLVEVGTTNRTRLDDYVNAITDYTAAILTVHPSNFRIVGFVEQPAEVELAALAKRYGIPLVHDLGSGALVDLEALGVGSEPLARDSLAAGADVVTFSADKLLGGPQAGIILGRGELLEAIRRNPLARALRLDKTIIAALEATLRLYANETDAVRAIPTLRMAAETPQLVRRRALRLRRLIRNLPVEAEVVSTDAYVGGGALPDQRLQSWALALTPTRGAAQDLATGLRRADPPVIARVSRSRLLLDLRTVADDEVKPTAAALRAALAEDDGETT